MNGASSSHNINIKQERPESNGSAGDAFGVFAMTAEELKRWCVRANAHMIDQALKAPASKPTKPPQVALTEAQLRPLTFSVRIEDASVAFGKEIIEFCRKEPIVSLRELAIMVDFNFLLFTTKTLLETYSALVVETLLQKQQPPLENLDERGKTTWKMLSDKGTIKSLRDYAKVQVASFKEELKEKELARLSNIETSSGHTQKRRKKVKTVEFATNIDLSDEAWEKQLAEIRKLPPFLRVDGEDNLLNFVGYTIHGINSIQLYLKVGGCRTTAHQENNNVPSVNLSIGPGTCEWFAVPMEYSEKVYNLCKKNRCDFLRDPIWPNVDELREAGIPVYNFQQGPGDIVWINAGCIHWVQANGVCNNIAWNVCPISTEQYQLSMDRFQWNKGKKFPSLVPMIRASWNLSREYQVTDPDLFKLIKTTMMQSLIQAFQHLKILEANNVVINDPEMSLKHVCYCNGPGGCQSELFNYVFERNGRYYCVACAQLVNFRLYTCYQEYAWEELMQTYNRFTLLN